MTFDVISEEWENTEKSLERVMGIATDIEQ
jgi:hypothetical protein